MKRLRKGSRVCVVGKVHKKGQRCGTVKQITKTRVVAIVFDDMPRKVHRWYVASELKPEK